MRTATLGGALAPPSVSSLSLEGVLPFGADDEFVSLAARLGHDKNALARGEVQTSFPHVADLADMREIFVRADDATRLRRQAVFAQQPTGGRARMWQGVHDRGEANIIAGLPVKESDLHGISVHFPACLKAISIRNLDLSAGEVFDVTTLPSEWNVGDREELYVVLNVDTCTLRDGARIRIQGNLLSIVIQRLDIIASPDAPTAPTPDYHHIGVLPTGFPVDTNIDGPLNGPDGVPGEMGQPGRAGASCQSVASLLGPVVTEAPPLEEREGGDAAAGAPGGRGRRGRTGGMCKLAELSIREFVPTSAPLFVFSQAGRGGDGGKGGDGGDGGQGGAAGHGIDSRQDEFPHGRPGRGGDGGAGGNGGCGGNGGVASHIFIACPEDQQHWVQALTLDSVPGIPGEAGSGGAPGKPGVSVEGEVAVQSACPGKAGKAGVQGRSRPAARVYLNEKLLT